MIHRTGLGIGCALVAAATYGLVPNFVRAAFENGVPPVESIFFRTSVVAVGFSIIAAARGDRFAIPRQAYGAFAGQVISTLIISVGYLSSIQFIPVGLAVIIFYSFPVLVMLTAPAVEGHAPGILPTLIAVFAFAGLAVAIGPGFNSLDIRGILLASAASLACVLQLFSGRAISRYLSPIVFGALVHIVIWPATLLIALVVGGWSIQIVPGGSALPLGYAFLAGVGGLYLLAYLLHMSSLRFAPASTVAPFYNLEPVVTTAVAGLLLGERLALNQYAGGGMVLTALLASSFVGTKNRK